MLILDVFIKKLPLTYHHATDHLDDSNHLNKFSQCFQLEKYAFNEEIFQFSELNIACKFFEALIFFEMLNHQCSAL